MQNSTLAIQNYEDSFYVKALTNTRIFCSRQLQIKSREYPDAEY